MASSETNLVVADATSAAGDALGITLPARKPDPSRPRAKAKEQAMQKSSHCGSASRVSPIAPKLMLMALAAVIPILFATGCQPSPLPTDAQDACQLPAATFAGWFQSGTVSLNGVVNPADSTQNLAPNCGFYAWSEQMFMWLTSPASSAYGGGAHIFDSPAFYDVSPPDASGNRTFLAHTP